MFQALALTLLLSSPVANRLPPSARAQATADAPAYDPSIFLQPLPPDRLAALPAYNGAPAKNLAHDKQFRKLASGFIPDCLFHFGRDFPLSAVLERALEGSTLPIRVQDGRYLMASGWDGPGRAFAWIDLQQGIALGAFYFHPSNGEPTPTLTVFSRQVKEESLVLSQLPPEFSEALRRWTAASGIPAVTTRYFIGGNNKKIVLEHNEDFCTLSGAAAGGCDQLNADAADADLNDAYYLKQVGYATNATARMIEGADQIAWLHLRENTCRIDPDPLHCRIRLTREHVRVIVHHAPPHPAPHPGRPR